MTMDEAEKSQENFELRAVYALDARHPKFLRLICVDEQRQMLLFKVLEKKWSRAVKAAVEMPLESSVEMLRCGKMVKIQEFVRPKFMTLSDWELEKMAYEKAAPAKPNEKREKLASAHAKAWIAARDSLFAVIEDLVAPERLAQTYSPKTPVAVLAKHAESKGVSLQQLKRILHKYAWFGLAKSALLELRPLKGTTGGTRLSGAKRGRKRDVAKLGGREDLAGNPLTARDVELIDEVLMAFYVRQRLSLTATYEELETYYVVENQYGVHKVSANKYPSWRQFEERARKQILRLKLDQLRALHSDREDVAEARGKDWHIALEVGDVFDLDATPFNKESIETFGDEAVKVNVGKATVFLVIDRRSKKIVGWHVCLKDENWQDGYRLALFCAFSDKTKQLEYLRIDEPDAFPIHENIIPRKIFVDGGPGAAKAAREAMARFGIGFARAPAGTPEAKGGVEGAIGEAQNDQADDGGAYRRNTDRWEREKRRLAKLLASESAYELEQKLVRWIIRRNQKLARRALLSAEMKAPPNRVLPSSNEIFSWGIRRLGGVEHRRLSDEEVYLNLLDHAYLTVNLNGVRIETNQYKSAALRAKWAGRGASFVEKILFTPSRPESAYWVTEDGLLDRLERDEDSRMQNGALTIEELQFHARLMNVHESLEKEKANRKAKVKVTKSMHDKILERRKRANGVLRKKPTADQGEFRAVAQAIAKSKRPMDADPIEQMLGEKQKGAVAASSPSPPASKKANEPRRVPMSGEGQGGSPSKSSPRPHPTRAAAGPEGAAGAAPAVSSGAGAPASPSSRSGNVPQQVPERVPTAATGSYRPPVAVGSGGKTVAQMYRERLEASRKEAKNAESAENTGKTDKPEGADE